LAGLGAIEDTCSPGNDALELAELIEGAVQKRVVRENGPLLLFIFILFYFWIDYFSNCLMF